MKRLLLVLWMTLAFVPLGRSQEDEDTIKKLFDDAIQTMGGEAYLSVTDMVSDGQMFGFNAEGDSSGLIKFKDYTKLPDKSRFEEGNRKKELDVTVFNLGKNEGWIMEGQKPVREATADEMKAFRNAVKHAIDIIFRVRYKDPETKKFYLGPGDGNDITLELIKLVDAENDEVTVYIDRISKLPAKIEYREMTSKGLRLHIIKEFSQWHVIQGINTPMRIDTSINGRRSEQQFIINLTYNNNLPDSFFSKPIPPK